MKVGIATGTPIIDGIGWIGAVVACVESNVLAIGMGDDPSDTSAWRCFARRDVMLSRGLAYVTRNEAARERVIRSWHRKCGRLDGCVCEAAERRVALPRPPQGAARPRQPMIGAQARQEA